MPPLPDALRMPARPTVRDYVDEDWPQVWPLIEEIVRAGDTFPYPVDLTEAEARPLWLENGPGGRTTVATEGVLVLGTAKMGHNRPGPGSHVATASYMVAGEARGRGVGRALVVDSLDWARESGYAAMQFNAVVATNTGAVKLYESLGFTVVGTVPRAHELPSGERVGLKIMHIDL
jgi:GNAT superfamily N-acetyltransferase